MCVSSLYSQDNLQKITVASGYYDIAGQYHETDEAVYQTINHLLNIPLPQVDAPYYDGWLVALANQAFTFSNFSTSGLFGNWQLLETSGGVLFSGTIQAGEDLFIEPLDMGYYQLVLETETVVLRYLLLVAPEKVFTADTLLCQKKPVGLTVQLYSLCSQDNWGIGDFRDLANLCEILGELNIDFVGINPLHALFTANPSGASPYSPSSRRWLNPLYLSLPDVSGYVEDASFLAEAKRLRGAATVDYAAVWTLKKAALKAAFARFSKYSDYADARAAFMAFVEEKGESLYGFALFEAIDNALTEVGSDSHNGWLGWPSELQDVNSEAVKQFAVEKADLVRFYQWLQWLCAEQLAMVKSCAHGAHVSLGLYGDLAVGVARGGADTWLNLSAFVLDISVGAPPDPLGPAGQNWQLPPLNPIFLQASGFTPFIELIRENMRHYGVLRIDHVMGLLRLWWITGNEGAGQGAYVHYPVSALLAILRIESHRSRCVVIGEDLGIVPDEIRHLLDESSVLGYSVMYFAREGEQFIAPQDLPYQAITVTSTHDVAPLSGFWKGKDLKTMADLGVFTLEQLAQMQQTRTIDKTALVNAMKKAGCLPNDFEMPHEMTSALRYAVHQFNAMTNSQLLALQLENLLDVDVNFNVPGIADGYPNWAIKLPVILESLSQKAAFVELINMVTNMRNFPDTNAYPPPDELERACINSLFFATNNDPFAYLGRHNYSDNRVVVRTIQPDATAVVVIDREERVIVQLKQIDARGLFVGYVPESLKDYLFAVSYADAPTQVVEDVYRFPSALSELDSWLLGQGNHLRPYEVLGAHLREVCGVAGVQFAVWAPNAKRVSVVGEFNCWDGRRHPMRFHAGIGVWEIFIPAVSKNALYKFEILDANGGLLTKADPYAFGAELRPGTASVVRGLPMKASPSLNQHANDVNQPISIYEVHLGSWRRRLDNNFWLTYNDLAHELIDYVKYMGFTHIELMPLSEYPFDGSWGYQATGLYAPTSRFGSPEELKALIEAAHDAGIHVILDWVVGHFPTDDHGLRHFDGTALYEHADPREGYHQDWNTLIYNFGRTEVKNYLRGNALYWIERFGFDGLRVDAVASMVYRDYSRKDGEWIPNQYGGKENIEAIEFLRDTNTMLKEQHPESTQIAEESTAFCGVTKPEGLNFSFKWNMGWMNDTLRYMQEDPVHRKYHHHLMTFGMVYQYSETFILPISHDEVVHGKGSMLAKMPGDCWQKFANLRAYYGFMWGFPGKKLLFMGCEFAQGREWNYEEPLDWFLLNPEYGGWHSGVQNWVRDLNFCYRRLPALYQQDNHPDGFDWLVVDDKDNSVLIFERRDKNGGSVIVACNFTPVPREGYRFGVNTSGTYQCELNSDDECYNGSGMLIDSEVATETITSHGRAQSLSLDLPPLSTVILSKRWEA